MRAGALSAGWWNFGGERPAVQTEDESIGARLTRAAGWDPEEFERHQVSGLVREIFLAGGDPAIRQVVFSAIEPETAIADLCRRVGEVLAAETAREVAYADESRCPLHVPKGRAESQSRLEVVQQNGALRETATQHASNLYCLQHSAKDLSRATSVQRYLQELRREFEYSIVAAPAAVSNEPFTMARFADGIVLVLSAQRTRRISALKVRNALSGLRLLGTVLCDREFPIPSGIYRRL